MAGRKTHDDMAARETARETITAHTGLVDETAVAGAVEAFRYVQYETTSAKIGGEEIAMRRVVMTSAWQVVDK